MGVRLGAPRGGSRRTPTLADAGPTPGQQRQAGASVTLRSYLAPNLVHLHSGAAGVLACGDLLRVTLDVQDGRVAGVECEREGCAALRACATGLAELAEG